MAGISTAGVLVMEFLRLRVVLGGMRRVGFVRVRGIALVLSRDAASCCKSLGQQRRAVGPLQGDRAPGMFNRISGGSGSGSGGLDCQGNRACRVSLPGRG